MCGITGFLDLSKSSRSAGSAAECVRRMADQLDHRGPDDQGVWTDPAAGIALGFRRLAIVDLTVAGHQPMKSASDRYVLVFNGEIYNHAELRKQVLDQRGDSHFRGRSDTEVLLALIELRGVQGALEAAVGMFAIAVWDRTQRALTLARDRLGEKPLYYARFGDTVMFGSELKALRAHPQFQSSINRHALALYMRHGYIPAPYSIYRKVQKLPPGTVLTVRSEHPTQDLPAPQTYWSMRETVEQGRQTGMITDEAEAIRELDRVLRAAVADQMVADVPLGAFLSGGIDSSLVSAMMQQQCADRIKTFSIGFEEPSYNEAPYAGAIARHLGTEHTELIVSASQAQAVIPRLAQVYDEPFADSSQIPTILVAQLARKHVTVSLSGDGGDELFQGYSRYHYNRKVWNRLRLVPMPARRMLGSLLDSCSPAVLGSIPQGPGRRFSRASQIPIRAKLRHLINVLSKGDFASQYHASVSTWHCPETLVLGSREPATLLTDPSQLPTFDDVGQRMQYLDSLTYLPDDILTKVDRATMAVSLEARVPMLDHRVVQLAWRLSPKLLHRDGKGKWILRRLLSRYLPSHLFERPKMGFGIPLGQWLRGPLRDWAEDCLSERRLHAAGYLASRLVREKWQQHLSGQANWQYALWNVLMFQSWHESLSADTARLRIAA
jgi:asparagine synthase (glutamine-hydrolysing)